MPQDPIRLGVIGCGGFGLFALQQFAQVPGVEPVGMAGTRREAARAAAARFGIPDIQEVEALVERPDVDLVYISTPPFLHHPQAMLALSAGKHVICEKPLALSLQQADEMIAAARGRDLLLAADLMQRYNPVYDAVGRLIRSGALGRPIRGCFENYAADEGLPPDHWFWDREKSGGIFVEHGVHFFDMFAGWFGEGKVESALAGLRPGTTIEEQVQCTVRYRDNVIVNFYHGFHQPHRLDRQQMRIIFERGDVALEGWIPTVVRIHAIADEKDTRTVQGLLPGAVLDATETYPAAGRGCRGRHKDLDVYQMFKLTYGQGHEKLHRYSELLRAMMADQAAWIRDRDHCRTITEENGRRSLATALEADRLARHSVR